jgi:hypothetical protein
MLAALGKHGDVIFGSLFHIAIRVMFTTPLDWSSS